MKLIEAVNAYAAAEEMSKESWPYSVSLAVVKLKKALKDEAEFFLTKERELVDRYALKDERGNIALTERGTFALRDGTQAAEYEQARQELCQTEVPTKWVPMRVTAPACIKPAFLEALDGFIEFTA